MSVAIGIMATTFALSLSLFFVVKAVGDQTKTTDVNVVAVAMVAAWISGGILFGLVAARLAQ